MKTLLITVLSLGLSSSVWAQKCAPLKGGGYSSLVKISERMAKFDITTAVFKGPLYFANYAPQLLIEDLNAPLAQPIIHKTKSGPIKFEYESTQRALGFHLNWTGQVTLDRMTSGSYRVSIIDLDACNKYVKQTYIANRIDFSGEAADEEIKPEIVKIKVLPLFLGKHTLRIDVLDRESGLEKAELISNGVNKGAFYYSDRHGRDGIRMDRSESEINRIVSRTDGSFEMEGFGLSADELINSTNIIRLQDVHGNIKELAVPKQINQ